MSDAAHQGETAMKPSLVRKRILDEHARLRRHLEKLEAAILAWPTDPGQRAIVESTACELLTALVEHTELEDAILAPALQEIDAWGAQRAGTLLEHHIEQRAQLQNMLDAYQQHADASQVVRMTQAWIADVRTDMEHEEREIVTRNLLRDDLIAIDMEAG